MHTLTALKPGSLVRITTVHQEPPLICEVVDNSAEWLHVRLTKSVDNQPTERYYSVHQIVFADLVGEQEAERYRKELKEDHPRQAAPATEEAADEAAPSAIAAATS